MIAKTDFRIVVAIVGANIKYKDMNKDELFGGWFDNSQQFLLENGMPLRRADFVVGALWGQENTLDKVVDFLEDRLNDDHLFIIKELKEYIQKDNEEDSINR